MFPAYSWTMPKRAFKRRLHRILPDHEKMREHRYLRHFGHLLARPTLWHLNRRNVAAAFAVGLFFAFMPVPFQMVLAAGGAIYFNANLPISVAMVWLTNPITIPPIFYFTYVLGNWILGNPSTHLTMDSFSWDAIYSGLPAVMQAVLVGCLFSGVVAAIAGYIGIRVLWRIMVLRRWRRRQQARRAAVAAA